MTDQRLDTEQTIRDWLSDSVPDRAPASLRETLEDVTSNRPGTLGRGPVVDMVSASRAGSPRPWPSSRSSAPGYMPWSLRSSSPASPTTTPSAAPGSPTGR